jgi:hypothetical protein
MVGLLNRINMASLSVDEIQSSIAALVDQNQDTTQISQSDYDLRLRYMNMALDEWSEAYDWDVLYKEYYTQTSTSTGNATVVLPGDFRKLASFPKITHMGNQTDAFPEVLPYQDNQFNDTDLRVNMLGNPNVGYSMFVKGVQMQSGASIMIPYYYAPASLASGIQVPEIPCGQFIFRRVIAYLWQGREDPRYPQAQTDADRELQNLIMFESTKGRASFDDTVKTVEQTRAQYRWGRD